MFHPLTYRSVFISAMFILSIGCADRKQKAAESSKKPNILIIVADDMGEEVGCYGDPYAQTPNIDEFAREGVQFTNAYVTQASCSPSRSSILTGLYPHQSGQTGLSHLGISMNDAYPNLFSILKEQGYFNGIMGKLHVEPHSAFPYDYGIGGFDVNDVKVPKEEMVVELVDVNSSKKTVQEKFTRYDIPVMADSAQAFIRRRKDRPFFLMMNFLDPHRPFRNQIKGHPEKILSKNDVEIPSYCGRNDEELLEEVVGYYNGVSRFDEGLGYVMDMLEKENLMDNTLIILLGDHGAPLPRAKMTSYEAGLRIPMMVQFPKGPYKNLKNDSFVSTIDILPTILDALDIDSLPAHTKGLSWTKLLDGKIKERDFIAGEYTAHVPWQLFPQRAIRKGKMKIIYNPFAAVYKNFFSKQEKSNRSKNSDANSVVKLYKTYADTPEYQLFDLNKDPDEFNNLATDPEYRSELETMQDLLMTWQTDTNDPLLNKVYNDSIDKQIKAYIEEKIVSQ